jgi:hypothetical protein
MHRSRLPLTKWFSAIRLIATHAGMVSARCPQRRLGIAYQTAWVLKRKLQLTYVPEDSERLQGRVEVDQVEIPVEFYSAPFHMLPDQISVAIALEVPSDEPSRAKGSVAPTFNRIRLARVRGNSAASIHPFVRDNVMPGTTLLTEDLDTFLGLLDCGYDLIEFGEVAPQAQDVLFALKRWLDEQAPVRYDAIEERLRAFVAEANWHFSLTRMLASVLHQKPASYWDMIGRENPHKGASIIRRRPRRRKTATGMREDGSGAS